MKTGKKVILFLVVFVCMMAISAQSVKEVRGDGVFYLTTVTGMDSDKSAVLALSPSILASEGFDYDKAVFRVGGVDFVYSNEASAEKSVLLDDGRELVLNSADSSLGLSVGDVVILEVAAIEIEEAAEEKAVAEKAVAKRSPHSLGIYGSYAVQNLCTDGPSIWSDSGCGVGYVYRYRLSENILLGATLDAFVYDYSSNGYVDSYMTVDFMTQIGIVVPVSDSFNFDMAMLAGCEFRSYGSYNKVSPALGVEFNAEYSMNEIVSLITGFKIHSTAKSAFSSDSVYGVVYKPYLGLTFCF